MSLYCKFYYLSKIILPPFLYFFLSLHLPFFLAFSLFLLWPFFLLLFSLFSFLLTCSFFLFFSFFFYFLSFFLSFFHIFFFYKPYFLFYFDNVFVYIFVVLQTTQSLMAKFQSITWISIVGVQRTARKRLRTSSPTSAVSQSRCPFTVKTVCISSFIIGRTKFISFILG